MPRLRSQVLFEILANDSRSILASNDDHAFRYRDNLLQSFFQERLVSGDDGDGDDTNGFAPSPLEAPPLDSFLVEPINVTEHVYNIQLYLCLQRTAPMRQDGDRLDFFVASSGGSHDIGLGL